MNNPLLDIWSTSHQLPPFDLIKDAHFLPAIDITLDQVEASIQSIAQNPDAPSFDNTITALEIAELPLDRILGVFYAISGSDTSDERDSIQRILAPKLSEFSSKLSQNKALFARIEALWQSRDEHELTAEQQRVLMLTHQSFIRSGAKLQGSAAKRLQQITSQLASLGTNFTQNLLTDERTWFMTLTPEQLASLPDFLISAATAAGVEKGQDGPVITLSRSLVIPFLQFSPNRLLREKAYRAWTSRGANGGATDNRDICAQTLALREERAQILGFDTFSQFKLETEMAKTPQNVRKLLMRVWDPALKALNADAKILTKTLHDDGLTGALQAWDWHYYSEKRRAKDFELDEAQIKPYFQLERMIEAAFYCANKLFNLEFTPLDAQTYHDDVRVWDVSRNGQHVAVFFGDYFARSSKRSGAWCMASRNQHKMTGPVSPHVYNVCNFAKPAQGAAALLSYDDARTLFHEFGHALHQMLSNVTYYSVSGTNVARDFVELPSQLFEHWLEVPEVLTRFATHVQTGESLPEALLQKILQATTYDAGFNSAEFLASAIVDLEFHDGPAPQDPMQMQARVLQDIGMPEFISMRHATPQFAHIFSGDGYSCGYYSYLWSEVMDSDAFEAFEETGDPFNPELAKRLEDTVLSKGGTVDPEALYKAFRGRAPDEAALLRGRGFNT